MKRFDTRHMYRLTATSYNGIEFTPPTHVWFGGEVRQSWNFSHPCTVKSDGDSHEISGPDGDKQTWELVL